MSNPLKQKHRQPVSAWIMPCFILLGFLPCIASGSAIPDPIQTSSGESQKLDLQPKGLDLGAVGHGQKYPALTFQVTNTGDTPQTFTIRPSCGCMKLTCPPTITVEAESTQEIGFQLSLGRGWGVFSKRIDLVDGNRRVLASFPVKALFHPGVKTGSMEAVLTTSPILTLPESKTRVDFISESKSPVLSDLKSTDPRIEFEIVQTDQPGVTSLEVRSLSTWPAGRFSSTITGLCNGLPFKLPVRGRAFGSLIHEPHSWNLKQVRDLTINPEALTIRRADGKPLKITEMKLEWLRPVDGFQVELSQETLKDGSVKISAKALDPLPKVNKGFYGKVVLTTDVETEPTVRIDLLGVIQLPGKASPK